MSDTLPNGLTTEQMLAIVEKATPGPINVAGAGERKVYLIPNCFPRDCWIAVSGDNRTGDTAHIAACDRETILTLLADRERAEKAERQRDELLKMVKVLRKSVPRPQEIDKLIASIEREKGGHHVASESR